MQNYQYRKENPYTEEQRGHVQKLKESSNWKNHVAMCKKKSVPEQKLAAPQSVFNFHSQN